MSTLRPACDELKIARPSRNHYGSLEPMVRQMRDHRLLDLKASLWREAHPHGTYAQWQSEARNCLRKGLHCIPGEVKLDAEILERTQRDGFVMERVAFNTTPWSRVEGYFLLPNNATQPVPGLVVFHAWGGPMLFGKERIVNCGRDHPVLAEHRARYYSGKYFAEEFARSGYAVIVIDAHHFGSRIPFGLNGLPDCFEAFDLSIDEAVEFSRRLKDVLYLGVRQLNWAGTTWAAVTFQDDASCVDYLLSRPEVDGSRIGCTGLSGGGWRTNILAALDDRLKAAVSGCWMTTGDHQQLYNLAGAIGTFCLLPGVWDRLDVPDLIGMAAPCAVMVISNADDDLFPPEGQQEAACQIAATYEWAGLTHRFLEIHPDKPHCFDAELQQQAIAWFHQHLKSSDSQEA